jgi:hypothetical protein
MTPEQSLDIQFEHAISSGLSNRPNLAHLQGLLAQGAHVDGCARNGLPLRHAVTKLSIPLIHFLAESGANLNARNPSKVEGLNQEQPHFNVDTILHWAAYRSAKKKARDFEALQHAQVMLELIALGANPQTVSSYGQQPADLVDSKGPTLLKTALTHPIHVAVVLHNPGLCIKLLDRGFDPDEKNAHQTAWRLAEIKSPACLAIMRSWQAKVAVNRMLDEKMKFGSAP